jgi:hypothetical protein
MLTLNSSSSFSWPKKSLMVHAHWRQNIIDLATIALVIICYGAEKASKLHAECCQTHVFVWEWVLHMAGAQMLVEA